LGLSAEEWAEARALRPRGCSAVEWAEHFARRRPGWSIEAWAGVRVIEPPEGGQVVEAVSAAQRKRLRGIRAERQDSYRENRSCRLVGTAEGFAVRIPNGAPIPAGAGPAPKGPFASEESPALAALWERARSG